MFNNVGGKIKSLAKILFWVGIVLSIITYVVCLCMGAMEQSVALIFISFLVLFFGVFGSWVYSVMLYAFGSIVESNEKIAKNTEPEMKPEAPFETFN